MTCIFCDQQLAEDADDYMACENGASHYLCHEDAQCRLCEDAAIIDDEWEHWGRHPTRLGSV